MKASIVHERSLVLRAYAEALSRVGTPEAWSRPPLQQRLESVEVELTQTRQELQGIPPDRKNDGKRTNTLATLLDVIASAAFLNWQNGQRTRAIELLEEGLTLIAHDPIGLSFILLGVLLEGAKAPERRRAQALLDNVENDRQSSDWRASYFRTLLELQRRGPTLEAVALVHQSVRANESVFEFLLVGRDTKAPHSVEMSPPGSVGDELFEEAAQYAVVARPAWEATAGALDWLASLRDTLRAPVSPVGPSAATAYAQITWGLGSRADRRAHIDHLLLLDPGSPDAHVQAGELTEEEGLEWGHAWSEYSLANDLLTHRYAGGTPDRHDTLLWGRALRGAGRMAALLGDRVLAIELFEKAYRYRSHDTVPAHGSLVGGPRVEIEYDRSDALDSEWRKIACLAEMGGTMQWTRLDRITRNGWAGKQSPVDSSYFQVLFLFARRGGGTHQTRAALRHAMVLNPFVPEYLLKPKLLASQTPIDFDPGDRSDAMRYVLYARDGWKHTNGVLVWLLHEMEAWGWELVSRATNAGPG